jgi:heavy metal efflux system protein
MGWTALIIINLPFALIGGVFALYLAGLYLSVPAARGSLGVAMTVSALY